MEVEVLKMWRVYYGWPLHGSANWYDNSYTSSKMYVLPISTSQLRFPTSSWCHCTPSSLSSPITSIYGLKPNLRGLTHFVGNLQPRFSVDIFHIFHICCTILVKINRPAFLTIKLSHI